MTASPPSSPDSELARLSAELAAERAQRARLELALASSSEGIWEWEPATDRLYLSATLSRQLGLGDGERTLAGDDYLARAHPDDAAALRRTFAAFTGAAAERPVETVFRIRHTNGLWVWLRLRAMVQRDDRGRVLRVAGVQADVSTLKQVQSALRNVQGRYRMFYEAAPVALVLWNPQGQVIEWNRRAEALFGWPMEAVLGKRLAEQLLAAEDREAYAEMARSTLAAGGIGQLTTTCLTHNGERVRCAWSCMALRGNGSQLVGLLALALDVSEHYTAELRLRESESIYRTLVETSPDGVFLLDTGGRVLMANQRAASQFGFDHVGGLIGSHVSTALGDEYIIPVLDNPAERAGFIASFEAVLPRQGGGCFIAEINHTVVADSRGEATGIVVYVHDITRRRAIEEELAAYRRELELRVAERTRELAAAQKALAQIIDNSPVPAFVLDAEHRITHWNQACEKVIGAPAARMLGTADQWSAFYPEPRPVLADLVMINDRVRVDALYGGKVRPSPMIPEAFEAEDYFPLSQRWLFFTAAPIRDADGQVIGAIETLQDITERKQAEMALQEAKAVAEAAARVKAEFLSNMSHEMRTPLNAILGLVHLLLKTELTQKQRDHLTRLRSAGDMLLQLINDILDFSKIEAGKLSIEHTGFVLDDMLDNLSAMVSARAREKGLELHFAVDNDVPQALVGDPLRLTQILVNLAGNAVKFTEKGQIVIFVSVVERSGQAARLSFAVQDTGIGITPEQQARLFRAFSQADASTTRKYGGTGLGLTICKRLVELMGGSISLASDFGRGSTFLFELPLGIGEAASATAAEAGQRRALVIDDNAIARTVLSRLLEKRGYRVDCADSGEAAMARIGGSGGDPYALLFLDWNMPGMNGVEVARRIRRLGGAAAPAPAPQIVVVTAAGQSEAETAFADAEVNGLLLKPVSAKSLATALASLAQPDAARAAVRQQAPRLTGLRVLLVDDVPTNRLIAGEILDDEGARFDIAENGRQAVDKVLGSPEAWDVVLMDIQMPEMNGMEATRAIRADGRHARLPIIAMTAFALEEERERCLAAGMDGFLTKPVEPEAMIAALADIADRASTARRQAAPAPLPAAAAPAAAAAFPALPGIDTADGLRRMMNKPAFYEKMLKSFHDRFADAPATIGDHLVAGRLDEARREAHSAKGIAASLSANGLRDAALALEIALAEGRGDLEADLAAFSSALAEVLDGLRRQYGWTPPG